MNKLFTALKNAQQSVRSMEKTARNEFSRYDYVPHDAVIAEGRRALNAAGLALIVTHARVVGEELRLRLILAHESGESLTLHRSMPVVAGKTPPDKAVGAADTYALSYAVRGLLAMDRLGESPDERDDSAYASQSAESSPAKAASDEWPPEAQAKAVKWRAAANRDRKAFDLPELPLVREKAKWTQLREQHERQIREARDGQG